MTTSPFPQVQGPAGSWTRSPVVRLVGLLLVAAGAATLVRTLGWDQHLTSEGLRELTDSSGLWGAIVFLVAFAVAALLGVPPVVFIIAALASYGSTLGFGMAFLGCLLAATSTWGAARWARGSKPVGMKRPWLQRILNTVDRRPVGTVALLRALTLLSAPVTIALAMTQLRYRDYMLGTAVGLIPPLCVYAVGVDCLLG